MESTEQTTPTPAYDTDPSSTLEALIVTTDLIDVLMPNGKVWAFAAIRTARDRRRLIEDTDRFVKMMKDPEARKGFKDQGVRVPTDDEDLRLTYQIHARSRKPRLSQGVAFGLVNAPETLAYLDASLEAGDKAVMSEFRRHAREELRGKLPPTPSTDEGSPSEPESIPDDGSKISGTTS